MEGTEQALYEAVAPLVMNPDVIRYNKGYPFKTSKKFVWFIARREGEVIGFMPVERRNREWVINNYYALPAKEESTLEALLATTEKECAPDMQLTAVVQAQHAPIFEKHRFKPAITWKLYIKMTQQKDDKKQDGHRQQEECL